MIIGHRPAATEAMARQAHADQPPCEAMARQADTDITSHRAHRATHMKSEVKKNFSIPVKPLFLTSQDDLWRC